MRQIDAVNIMLRSAGQGSVNEISVGDAKSGAASDTLAVVRKRILLHGFTFNTDKITLPVNAAGRVALNVEWLKVRREGNDEITGRWLDGTQYLWDVDDNDWVSTATEVEVTFDIETFTEIPEDFAQWIAWEAAAQYFSEQKDGRDPPNWVMRNLVTAQSSALNSVITETFDDTTGWSAISSGGALVNVDGTLRRV